MRRGAAPLRTTSISFRINPRDQVALDNSVEHIIATDNSTEHSVVSVEMRLRRVRDEVLTAACVRPGQRHSNGAALIAVLIHFVSDCIAGSAVAIVARISVLRDEVWDDAMESRIPIVP